MSSTQRGEAAVVDLTLSDNDASDDEISVLKVVPARTDSGVASRQNPFLARQRAQAYPDSCGGAEEVCDVGEHDDGQEVEAAGEEDDRKLPASILPMATPNRVAINKPEGEEDQGVRVVTPVAARANRNKTPVRAKRTISHENGPEGPKQNVYRGRVKRTKRIPKPRQYFVPDKHGAAWSEEKPLGKTRRKIEIQRFDPSHYDLKGGERNGKPAKKKSKGIRRGELVLNKKNRGRTRGEPFKGSLWKYVKPEDGQTYILEVVNGQVSEQGNVNVLWKGYGKRGERVPASDLKVPTDNDFETFRRNYEATCRRLSRDESSDDDDGDDDDDTEE